eukprot:1688682-Pyramimonas_sp.AAC.1
MGLLCDPLVAYTGHVAFQWATAVWDSFPSRLILGATMEAAIEKLARYRHPWRVASSPADVACLSLDRTG